MTMQQSLDATFLGNPAAAAAGSVVFKTSHDIEVEGTLLRLTSHTASFEVYLPQAPFGLSEVLREFRIVSEKGVLYSGNAVLTNLIDSGTAIVCEAAIEAALLDLDLSKTKLSRQTLNSAFNAFVGRWDDFYRVLPEFKLAVTDLTSFLGELRLWLGQVEVGLSRLPSAERSGAERNLLENLPVRPALHALFERFDAVAADVPEEIVPAHRKFCRQHLHPLLLLAPFSHRIYAKPLGYAGDYEMIDMIIRNGFEGGSLFAKLIHSFILDLPAAHSVRNRADFFARIFVEETARVRSLGRVAKFYSLGCGPAREVQQFISESSLANEAAFRLLDFNPDTLAYAGRTLDELKHRHQRRTPIDLVKESVYTMLKGPDKPVRPSERYDLIYCSGLYDYLNDRVCKALNTHLYRRLAPGGILIITNFDALNPIRNLMEFVFEWFLIHRNAKQMNAMAPENATADECAVTADPTGCNIFLQVRKPES